MNTRLLAIAGTLGIGAIKGFSSYKGGGNSTIDDRVIESVCAKFSSVVEIDSNPKKNIDTITDVILKFKNDSHFHNMIENLNITTVSEYNSIFYFSMSKDTFEEIIQNYIKNIKMWFDSDFIDLSQSSIDIKSAWFNKGQGNLKIQRLYYENDFYYVYSVFKKLPFLKTKDEIGQAVLTAKLFANAQKRQFESGNFIKAKSVNSRFDVFTTFSPRYYSSPQSGYDSTNYNIESIPKTKNILDSALSTSMPTLLDSFTNLKRVWNPIVNQDFSDIILPIWMPPFELHYLFMNTAVEGIVFGTRIKHVKLWSS